MPKPQAHVPEFRSQDAKNRVVGHTEVIWMPPYRDLVMASPNRVPQEFREPATNANHYLLWISGTENTQEQRWFVGRNGFSMPNYSWITGNRSQLL